MSMSADDEHTVCRCILNVSAGFFFLNSANERAATEVNNCLLLCQQHEMEAELMTVV